MAVELEADEGDGLQRHGAFDINNNRTIWALEKLFSFQMWYTDVHRYVALTLCVVGLMANVVHVLVLTRPRMRQSSVHTVLIFISLSDMGTMTSYSIYLLRFEFFKALNGYSYYWIVFLKFHAALTIYFHATTLYLVVLMAVIRYTALNVSSAQLFNNRRTYVAAGVIATFVLLMCLPTFLAHGISPISSEFNSYWNNGVTVYILEFSDMMMTNNCKLMKGNLWLTGVFLKAVPGFLLLVFTMALIHRLNENKEKRKALIKEERRKRRGDFTNMMLLLMVSIFLVTELPQGVMAILNAMFTTQFHRMVYLPLADILDLLSVINCYVAFVVYCITSSRYRQTLLSLMSFSSRPPFSGLSTRQGTIRQSPAYDSMKPSAVQMMAVPKEHVAEQRKNGSNSPVVTSRVGSPHNLL
ncbi:unnamed protein product [Caenorhabditis auriculariae]|uniref:G-protein coupled receptors family 1 profile domain-containing protein n=1 Tax=Caenorhabditis auriculariae TaxID=2777116 RepID=A0A8S1HQ67_9PELO|nr:unnamed protein product [Caenorhabditis auriculariae]